MGYDTMAMLAFWFVNMTMINRVLEGSFISATADMAVINNLGVFRSMELFGFISVSVPNMSMLTAGIPRLIKFDYSFFGGHGGFIQYSLFSISFAVAFLLFVIIIGGLISNFLNRVR